MTEEIKSTQTTEEMNAVESGQQANAGAASRDGGTERKSMVSWAAWPDWAVKRPKFIHGACSRFHNYSLRNHLLALFQCFEPRIQPRPLATSPIWRELGRHVKKVLTHCGPPTCTRTKTVKEDGTEQDEQFTFVYFTYKAHWFLLAQREGAELKPAAMRATRIAPARCTDAAHRCRLVLLQAQENRTPATAPALMVESVAICSLGL